MSTAIGTYVKFLQRDGTDPLTPFNIQNFHQGETVLRPDQLHLRRLWI